MGAIQPCAILLLVGPDWRVATVSQNAAQMGLGEAEGWLGQPIADVLGDDAVHEVRNRMTWLFSDRALAQDFGLRLGPDQAAYDVQVRLHGDYYLIEAEPAAESRLPDPVGMARSMMDRIDGTDFQKIADNGLRQARALTGFHRVVLCDRAGAVLASSAAGAAAAPDCASLPGADAFPRVIADRDAECSPLVGHKVEETARLSTFVEPDEGERTLLAAIGVAATMSLPLRIDGEHVGTFHAHHRSPKRCGAERRAVTGLLAERLAARMTRHGWKP